MKSKNASKAKKGSSKKKKPSRLAKLLTWIQLMVLALLWMSAASVYVSPEKFSLLSLLGIAFPIFLLMAAGTTLITLLLRPRRSWIGIVGILVCSGSIRTYFPLNFTTPAPKTALKVISYNTLNYGEQKTDKKGNLHIVNYIAKAKPQILCMQESHCTDANRRKSLKALNHILPYADTVHIKNKSGGVLECRSCYPIVKKELICHHFGNGSAAFFLVPKKGDTILVVNNHLQSMGFSKDEREKYAELVSHPDDKIDEKINEARTALFPLLKKMIKASVERAKQAEHVAAYINQHRHLPVIVCGDFNDTPISYARYRILESTGESLTDCFRAAGNGMGRTFNRNAMFVRIDHIFCSSHFRPLTTYVDNDKEHSDHNPIVTCLMRE